MTAPLWFVESNLSFEIAVREFDGLSELGGTEDSMFDIVSYVWYRGDTQDSSLSDDLTTAGTAAVWVLLEGKSINERVLAIIHHQLLYLEKVTLCYKWRT
jgi:hypothetical protein